jgi:alanyl-tRNA synthetase
MTNRVFTEKVFYKYPYKSSTEATIIDVLDNRVILDKTIAYPEGGGQEGDRGVFIVNEKEVPFFDTQKGLGRTIYLDDFPTINVETVIYHFIDESDIKEFKVGEKVVVKIDTLRRSKLSISHSAIHLVLMFLEELYPGYEKKVYGASIKEDSARLDFRTSEKFTPEQMQYIEEHVNRMVKEAVPIYTFAHKKEPEAWYWRCLDYTIPCGGTHLDNTKYIGKIKVKRKNLGKNGQRVSCSFEESDYFLERYSSE